MLAAVTFGCGLVMGAVGLRLWQAHCDITRSYRRVMGIHRLAPMSAEVEVFVYNKDEQMVIH